MTDRRMLGSTGIETPPLMLGGNVFGWRASGEDAYRILDRFVDAGGTMIDTADVYSAWIPGHKGGESETVIGEWLARRGKRDDVVIATKVGMLAGEGGQGLQPTRIAAAVDASLKRLQTDYIDVYFAHRDDEETPLKDTLEAFAKLVEAGKVRHLGASNYTAERLDKALKIAAEKGLPAYQLLQPELNLMDRDQYMDALADLAVEKGLGVVTYFALASGFLTGKYRSEDDKSKSPRGQRMDKYLTDRGDAVLAAMEDVAGETDASLAQVALAWNAAQPGVTAPIASATSIEQLEDLLGSLELELNQEQLGRLNSAAG